MTTLTASRWTPAYTLFLLFLTNVLNVADRTLLGIVVDPVRLALGLSDTQMSIVSGPAFILFNLAMGIVIARWVDRDNRKRILILGIVLWSGATALTGLAQGFVSLTITRVLVGVGEAACFPVAISMIADLYAPERRPRAISVFHSSTFVAIVLGSILAGVLTAAYGWRAMFVICGVAGLFFVALLQFTMREPSREATDKDSRDSNVGQAIAYLIRMPGFVLLALGTSFAMMGVAVLPVWAPTFLLRSHGVEIAAVGAMIGPAVGIGGITGTICSGMIATRLARKKGGVRYGLLAPMVALPLAVPFYALFLFFPQLWLAMLAAAVMNFLLAMAFSPCMAVAVGIAPVQMRAVASTLILVAMGVIGSAVAPIIVGVASDSFAPMLGPESLRYGLALIIVTPIFGALFLWRAFLSVEKPDAGVIAGGAVIQK